MSRRPTKNSGSTLTEAIAPTELMQYAEEAATHEDRFLQCASKWRSEYFRLVKWAAERRYRSNFADRGRLKCLLNCLKRVPTLADQRKMVSRDRDDAQVIAAENRKADQDLASKHPKGDLIGSTPIMDFKSQGRKKHWGTPRKRRT